VTSVEKIKLLHRRRIQRKTTLKPYDGKQYNSKTTLHQEWKGNSKTIQIVKESKTIQTDNT
jgi:hypothetical protein